MVAEGAGWLIGQAGKLINETTTPRVGSRWFLRQYRTMGALAAVFAVPLTDQMSAAVASSVGNDAKEFFSDTAKSLGSVTGTAAGAAAAPTANHRSCTIQGEVVVGRLVWWTLVGAADVVTAFNLRLARESDIRT